MIPHPFAQPPLCGDRFHFWRVYLADIITRAKFYINRLSGFGVLTPPLFPTGLCGCPYNTVIYLPVCTHIQDGPKNETTLVRPTAATVQDKIKRI